MSTLLPTAFLAKHLNLPVAVFGAGVSGVAARDLVVALGGRAIIYAEVEPVGLDVRSNFGSVDAAEHGLLIVSPGFASDHPWVTRARQAGLTCWGELDLASLCWRGSVIAITGTNGKTTLTEFLAHALHCIGRDAEAVGNIGRPFSQVVRERRGGAPETLAICEVSSFQAELMQTFRADATLWTNFAEDHLDRHKGLAGYFAAKWHLLERTIGGDVFTGPSVAAAAPEYGQMVPAEAVVETREDSGDVLLRGTPFAHQPQRENFLIAAAWWRAAGLHEPALYAAAQSFKLGPHRLARVGQHAGITWWNDSKATNFHAVEAALEGFAQSVWLIAGGRAKGGDYAGFISRIAPKVKGLLLIGETAVQLAPHCDVLNLPYRLAGTLTQAVPLAGEWAQPGDDVLLSPGFASFDQYSGYAARGMEFEQLVNNLGTTAVLS